MKSVSFLKQFVRFLLLCCTSQVFSQADLTNFEKANKYYLSRQYKETIPYLNLAQKDNPKDHKIFFMRGRCNLELELYNQALDDFAMATNLLPQESEFMYYRGVCELKLQRHKAAVSSLEKSIEYDPYNFMNHFLIGIAFIEMTSNEKAREHFDKAIEDGSKFGFAIAENIDTKYYEEYSYLAERMKEDASKKTKSAKAYLILGLMKRLVKDNYGALIYFAKCLELDPTLTIAFYYHGLTLIEIKRYDKAMYDIFRYTNANPKDQKALILLKEIKDKLNSDLLMDSNSGEIYLVTEVMPEFPGGAAEMNKFISKNLNYPKKALDSGLKGRVIVSFVISPNGHVKDSQVMRSLSEECDMEAMRILTLMPVWKPGIRNGKPVSVRYTLPINFSIKE